MSRKRDQKVPKSSSMSTVHTFVDVEMLTLHDIYRRKSRSPSRSIHAQLGESENNPQCPPKSGPVRSFIGDDRF